MISFSHSYTIPAPRAFRPIFEKVTLEGLDFFLVQQDFMTQELKRAGSWEKHLYDFIQPVLTEHSNIIDLGANFGFHAVKLARICRRGCVFAFEPLNLAFSQLQANIFANSVENIRAFKFAVTDTSQTLIEMQPVDANGWAQGINIGNSGIGSGGDPAFTVRIDDCSLPKIDFIKIDIQGSEMLALRGMRKLISRDRPLFFIEIEEHHLRRMNTSSQEIVEFFLEQDYSLIRIRNNWPTDHICIPNARAAELVKPMTTGSVHATELIAGKRVELRFTNEFYYDSVVST